MITATLHVPDVSCDHCERVIKTALGNVRGVREVHVDIPAKEVRVSYDETTVDVERLRAALEAEDYPVAAVRHTPASG